MTSSSPAPLRWQEIVWPGELAPELAIRLLRRWATDPHAPRLVLEAWGRGGAVRYLLGASDSVLRRLGLDLPLTVPGAALLPATLNRPELAAAGRLVIPGGQRRALSTERAEEAAHAALGVLATVRPNEALVLQVILGRRRTPVAVSRHSPSATGWTAALLGTPDPRDSEERRGLRDKAAQHGFECTIRLGVVAAHPARQHLLMSGLLNALRTTEAPGVRLGLSSSRPSTLQEARSPWLWPLRLNVAELACLLGWPVGEPPFPGLPSPHPKRLPPAARVAGAGRVVGVGTAPGADRPLALTVGDSLQHLHVIGPTGTGKSTLLLNLVVQDMASGRGAVVIDPKGDLVTELLARVPDERRDDVVVLDPTDEAPVGLNPLAKSPGSPELVADGLLAVFHGLYADSWGPRTQDILHACLLTLARRGDASLVAVPLLLTNPGFRRSLTARLQHEDPIALGPFWAWYESLSDAERAAAIAPVMNKLRSVLLRRSLRAVLGQTSPHFDIQEVFTRRRILLVNLAKGTLGPEGSSLLGSLVIAQLWQATLARTGVAPQRRHPVMVYIDEVQDYLHLPTDLADALAQARGLGVGFTLAHQFLSQLPPAMRAAVLANARSRVCFQLPPEDAGVLARGSRELAAEDFTALARYEMYASLVGEGQVTPFAAGRTLPPSPATSNPAAIQAASRERYGRPLSEVEAGWADVAQGGDEGTPERLGRRPRRSV